MVAVLCKSDTPSDVESAFVKNEIVADLSITAPKGIVNVSSLLSNR